jgi:Planctomycete cytochrome C
MVRSIAGTLALALAALVGCSGDSQPRYVIVDPQCVPRYSPTFANVYENTLKASCGSQTSACHSAAGRKGGLSLESTAIAYTELLQNNRVVAGDPSCSEMVVRIHGAGQSYLMPPGATLAEPDRCAIEKWIAAGATAVPLATPSQPGTVRSP